MLERGEDGRAAVVDGAGRRGRRHRRGRRAGAAAGLAVDVPRLPATTRSATAPCFAGGWYLTGDLARRDADGYYWFVGRADDVIKSAGHLVGPFEVESALMEHPAVAEVGVIGKPDPVAGEWSRRSSRCGPATSPTTSCATTLLAFGRRRLGARRAPEVEFDQHLPHTSSGKVMRRLLKARELGLPEGDLSTLESGDEPASTATAGRPRADARPAPTGRHRLELLRQMMRIRRFEETLRRALQRDQIRGFLHLYVGEEAVAAGVMTGAEPTTTRSSRPTASTATRWPAACRWTR